MPQPDGRQSLRHLVPPDPDFSRLPVTIHVGSTPLFGVVLLLAGAVGPVAIFLVLSLIGWVAEVPPEWVWIRLGFALVPLGALPWGWWVLKSRTTVEIGAGTVTRTRTTPLGRRSWSEPLSSFRGLRLRRVLPPSSAQDRTPRHAVEMDHPDPDRRPWLTHTADEAMARGVLDALARLTGLPELTD